MLGEGKGGEKERGGRKARESISECMCVGERERKRGGGGRKREITCEKNLSKVNPW